MTITKYDKDIEKGTDHENANDNQNDNGNGNVEIDGNLGQGSELQVPSSAGCSDSGQLGAEMVVLKMTI